MTFKQLNPPVPLLTPKGKGQAWAVIDYGFEHDLMWVVALDETGEIWTFPNHKVRAQKNITAGRIIKEKMNAIQLEHSTNQNE